MKATEIYSLGKL